MSETVKEERKDQKKKLKQDFSPCSYLVIGSLISKAAAKKKNTGIISGHPARVSKTLTTTAGEPYMMRLMNIRAYTRKSPIFFQISN